MLTPTVVAEVEMLRWPGDAARRRLCAERDVPCLLLLEEGVAPPAINRPLEDWIRVPADEVDLVARIRRLESLGRRASEDPTVDDEGILHVGPNWSALSTGEATLARRLTADFGQLVTRDDLLAALNRSPATPTGPPPAADRRPRTLDLQICRLRRRIAAVGLTVSAVRGRGYVLEHARLPRQPSGSRPS
jgi:DNA-binding response OmpR family regulator